VLRAIFFDIDDTLFSTSEFAEAARRNAVRAMGRAGLNVSPEAALRELKEVVSEFSSNYDHHFDKLLARFPVDACQGANPAVVVAAGVIAYHETKWRQLLPFKDAIEALRVLAKTDLIRGIITDGLTIKQAEKLLRLGVYRHLSPDAIFISDQIGIGKPNPKIYLTALRRLGLEPGEAMYVGDNPRADIDPPNQIGMVTVRHRGTGKFANVNGDTEARYEIANFHELLHILKTDFEIDLPD
jgi:putative hydrolase of the HAD superfamily